MEIQGTTLAVSNLQKSKKFYENILNFEPDIFHEPTKRQSYKFEWRAYFAIIEDEDFSAPSHKNIVNFDVQDIDTFRENIKNKTNIEAKLSITPRGSKKCVILDPDENRLGFVAK